MVKLILAGASTLLLFSGCAREIVYVETAFPYIPPHKVEKQVFKPIKVDYEVTE